MTDRNELDLINLARAKNQDAYRELVERYQGRLFALAMQLMRNRADAEDLVQESFVKAYFSLDNFKAESKFYTWIYRILYNMAIDVKRARKRKPENFELDQAESVKAAENPENEVIIQDSLKHVDNLLAGLSQEHRTAVYLREVDGMSYDEIAKITGVNTGTVMSRLFYARKKLQESWDNLGRMKLKGTI